MFNVFNLIFNIRRLQGPYSKNYLSDRSFTNVNDYEFVDNFATPDTAKHTGKTFDTKLLMQRFYVWLHLLPTISLKVNVQFTFLK